jgi:hypothetical protein
MGFGRPRQSLFRKVCVLQNSKMLKDGLAGVEGFGSACSVRELVEPFLDFTAKSDCEPMGIPCVPYVSNNPKDHTRTRSTFAPSMRSFSSMCSYPRSMW